MIYYEVQEEDGLSNLAIVTSSCSCVCQLLVLALACVNSWSTLIPLLGPP
jgi:hypothetical protein